MGAEDSFSRVLKRTCRLDDSASTLFVGVRTLATELAGVQLEKLQLIPVGLLPLREKQGK